MPARVIVDRKIESAKDSRGRITHWNCTACEWTTQGFAGPSTAVALKAVCDTYDSHDCDDHKARKPLKQPELLKR